MRYDKNIDSRRRAIYPAGYPHYDPLGKHGIEIVGEAANGKSALKLAMQLSDIVIADISMPVMSGLELASQLNEPRPDIRHHPFRLRNNR
ncbi:MAG: response regulator [Blautia marasmi]